MDSIQIASINRHKEKTDIFTFQEVLKFEKNLNINNYYSNILGEIINILPEFEHHFSSRSINHGPDGKLNFPVEFGQATFIKKRVKIFEQKEIFVYKSFNLMNKYFESGHVDFPSLILYSILEKNNKKFVILNFHGLWEPAPKHDTEHRLRQSQIIIDQMQEFNAPIILAGDFNLRINTMSLKMFEDFGMRNLVKESGALTTRSSFYNKKWRTIDKHADYILVTKNVLVKNFKVMRVKVSDHLPLLLKFEV